MKTDEKKQIEKLVQEISKKLNQTLDQSTAQQHAWWLISFVLKKDKASLLRESPLTISEQAQTQLDTYIEKLITEHMPIAYIMGKIPFLDLELFIEPPLLIPRPETEEWVNNLREKLTHVTPGKLTILDIGTGSGCIALALAKKLPYAHVYALDITAQALLVAKKNARHNSITNCTFIQSDLFQQVSPNLKFDLIVSNPPYISEQEYRELELSVRLWEDYNALVAPDQGLQIIQTIIDQAPAYLRHNTSLANLNLPQIVIEIGYNQATAVTSFLQKTGYYAITVVKDYVGNNRLVCARYTHIQ